jgi:hypothetical protein
MGSDNGKVLDHQESESETGGAQDRNPFLYDQRVHRRYTKHAIYVSLVALKNEDSVRRAPRFGSTPPHDWICRASPPYTLGVT